MGRLDVKRVLDHQGWFQMKRNVHVIVDGQFGSTGKGVVACMLAELYPDRIAYITTNAGPNSGHTAYHAGEKIVNKQLPVSSTVLNRMGRKPLTYINGGAIIDEQTLLQEFEEGMNVVVSPTAAVVTQADTQTDEDTVKKIASTGKGTGPALQRKIGRIDANVAADSEVLKDAGLVGHRGYYQGTPAGQTLVEVSQGFSLGINSPLFYPNVTSRECTVAQALADARIPVQDLHRVIACYRTFPIRVGNTEGSSGAAYPDQREITWGDIRQKPELTTVTGRERRVFTWSWQQYRESLEVNKPDVVFINFMNYLVDLDDEDFKALGLGSYDDFITNVISVGVGIVGRHVEFLWGFGPTTDDVGVGLDLESEQ